MKRIAYGIVCILILLSSISCKKKNYIECEICGKSKAYETNSKAVEDQVGNTRFRTYFHCDGCKKRYYIDEDWNGNRKEFNII